jgi:protein-S-isoprenylcysteine O-methyltransferase Ste14
MLPASVGLVVFDLRENPLSQEREVITEHAVVMRIKNALASVAVVVLAYAFHHVSATNRTYLDDLYGVPGFSFTGREFLFAASCTYAALVFAYFLAVPSAGASKSLRFWQIAARTAAAPRLMIRNGLSRDDRLACLATLLKALFGPLMAMALMSSTMGLVYSAVGLATADVSGWTFRQWFDRHGYIMAYQIIIMADVIPFTVGYLIELPRLRNVIRSVDPTLLGWAAALICYTPFNAVLGAFLAAPGQDFPQFDNPTVHFTMSFLLLGLMAVYASASLALGFKGSNLTHRGIVTRGPYRFVRHPAYVCKNMAWWIGSIPIVSVAFGQSTLAGATALASVIGWTLLYVLRAVTEEDHLRSVDGEYAAYANRVRYRFIPGVL